MEIAVGANELVLFHFYQVVAANPTAKFANADFYHPVVLLGDFSWWNGKNRGISDGGQCTRSGTDGLFCLFHRGSTNVLDELAGLLGILSLRELTHYPHCYSPL